jgi:uncharacterized protein YeaO (DUF488 family)
MTIRLKRAYVAPEDDDGFRVLVDRLWPRGLSREQLSLDLWLRELAPSNALRQWFNHEADKWPEFRRRYFGELAKRQEQVASLVANARKGPVTLIYAAKDEGHNNAVALKEYLEKILSTDPGAATKEDL